MSAKTAVSQSSAKEVQTHYCHAEKRDVTPEECFAVSSSRSKNEKFCKKKQCKSPSRLCLSCVTYDEISKESFVIRPGAVICEFHTVNGYMTRVGQDPKEAKEERNAQTRAVRHRVESRKKDANVGKEPIVEDEVEVEADESSMQELNVVYGKEILELDPERVRRQENQPREEFDEEALNDLKKSILIAGQVQPALVIKVYGDPNHDHELDDGERRWICCRSAKIKLKAIVIEVENKAQQFAVSAIANFGRESHTPTEIAKSAARIKRELGWSMNMIAKAFGMESGYLRQHLAILKLHPDVQILVNPKRDKRERISILIANSLVKFPIDQQLKHAKHIMDKGMRIDQARRYLKGVAKSGSIVFQERKVVPAKSHNMLMLLLDITEDKLQRYTKDMNAREFGKMFESRSDTHNSAVKKQIRGIINALEKLKDLI